MSCVLYVWISCILTIICLQSTQSIMSTEVIPERAEIYYVNENYLTNAKAFIRRTSRRSPYMIHVEGTTSKWLADNVTLHGVFYEFLHNEYKRSFVEVEMKLCELVNKEPWHSILGESLASRGLICPAPPGRYVFGNLTVSFKNLPYVWPFEKIMFQAYAKLNTNEEILVRARFYATFKRDVPKGR